MKVRCWKELNYSILTQWQVSARNAWKVLRVLVFMWLSKVCWQWSWTWHMTHNLGHSVWLWHSSSGGGWAQLCGLNTASPSLRPEPAWPIMSCIRFEKLPSFTNKTRHKSPILAPPTQSGICFVDRTMDSGQITRMHNGNNQWRILTMFVANIEWQKHSDKDQNTTRKCGKGLAFHPGKYIGNPRRWVISHVTHKERKSIASCSLL